MPGAHYKPSLVFNNEIAAQQRMRTQPNVISEVEKGSKARGNFGEARKQKNQENKKRQKSQEAMEDKKDGNPSLFFHQIIDFAPAHFAKKSKILLIGGTRPLGNVIHRYSEHPLIRN